MIDELQVRNVALIREAALAPSARLTVLTGETGAGKTALVAACKLLMGARADSSMVREGASSAEVSGRIFPPLPRQSVQTASPDASLAEEEAGALPDEIVALRTVSADGRSRATLNGAMASMGELSRILSPLIELCGQHEYQTLLKPAEHARILDAWADHAREAAETYRHALREAADASQALEQMRAQANASTTRLEEARFTLKQIDAVNPQPGEYDELREFLAKAEHAEMLARNSYGASCALSGEEGALDALNRAIALLDEAARNDEELGAYAQSLRETCYVVEDVARDMAAYCESIEFDSATLAQAQDRMSALTTLLRSFGPTMEEVAAQRDQAAELVSLVDDAGERIAQAEAAWQQAEERLGEAARALTAARLEAAPAFAEEVTGVMGKLEMGTAELICTVSELDRAQWTKSGPCAVTFEFKPGKSMQPRPLTRIASGGEVSRVLLAVKAVLGAKDGTDTLIFDEVDAGVGGSTANALAAVLAQLAETHQVIVITHLAQVAAVADTHYTVAKSQGDTPETTLSKVEGEARIEEIARLLSGSITEASLAHARELLGTA